MGRPVRISTRQRPAVRARRGGPGRVSASTRHGRGSGLCIFSSAPWEARQAAPSGGGRCAAGALCMLRLHYFSDNPALVVEDDEESVYSIELIKEFEAVGRAWKAFLSDWLLKGVGLFTSPTLPSRSVFRVLHAFPSLR